MTEFSELVEHYRLPARDAAQQRPRVVQPPSWRRITDRARGKSRSNSRVRRLAYVDAVFPWMRSGFRYHEAQAILELRPDTMFFSLWDLTDPFPAPVHRLADFPTIAPAAGITDVYGVFLLFLEGLCGLRPTNGDPPHPFEGPNLSAALRAARIRLHGSIYPGGGFTPTPECLARVRALSACLETTFSYVPEVLEHVPGVTEVEQAFTSTSFYSPTSERWARNRPLMSLFAAEGAPRKGLDVALAAFRDFGSDAFHLHVAGPHEHRHDELPENIATFHGWLSPEALRELHKEVHVFVSPVSSEQPGDFVGAQPGMVDGFPTQTAADAMSSGCLLISANPTEDHRVLTPDVHYLEREPDPDVLRSTLVEMATDLDRARVIAEAGSEQVRRCMDVRRSCAAKLQHMGLLDDDATDVAD
jgi:glycosyltransferase involved in cell wall biosynthesis